MRMNKQAVAQPLYTHEGGRAGRQTAFQELERAVSACMLWENTFYEGGLGLADRIAELCREVPMDQIAALAVRARFDLKLRHVPLWLVRQMVARHSQHVASRSLRGLNYDASLVSETLARVIRRPDEAAEFISLYWKDGRTPLAKQVKLGLAKAFTTFTPYQLAKWNRDAAIKLRDAIFLAHVDPQDGVEGRRKRQLARSQRGKAGKPNRKLTEREQVFFDLIEGKLAAPDTWEVGLSAAKSDAEKRKVWTRLLKEGGLGYMALLMNLRNMDQVGVEPRLIDEALRAGAEKSWALPFRFINAAKHAPSHASVLSDAMLLSLGNAEKLPGETLMVVDVSGSMDDRLSSKGDTQRWEVAAALAVLARELSESCRVFTFSNALVEVPNFRGLPLVTAIGNSQQHGGTHLRAALQQLEMDVRRPRRIIVITDEQTHDGNHGCWAKYGYIINVAPYQPGLDVKQGWTRINGWSERLFDWVRAEEGMSLLARGEEDDR